MKAWPNLPRLFRNGSVEIVLKKSRTFSSNEFCVALSNFSFENVELFDATFRICPKDDLSPIKYFLYTRAFPICCSVSNFFLLLTFVTYCALPELRRPVFGKITLVFIVALFSAYLVSTVGNLAPKIKMIFSEILPYAGYEHFDWLKNLVQPIICTSWILCTYHPAVLGLNLKHKMFAFSIFSQIFYYFCHCFVKRIKISKRGRVWPIFNRSIQMLQSLSIITFGDRNLVEVYSARIFNRKRSRSSFNVPCKIFGFFVQAKSWLMVHTCRNPQLHKCNWRKYLENLISLQKSNFGIQYAKILKCSISEEDKVVLCVSEGDFYKSEWTFWNTVIRVIKLFWGNLSFPKRKKEKSLF